MTGFVSKKAMADSREPNYVYYRFLDSLRESGVTNMFGAAPYLQETFGLDRYEAKDILLEWMQLPRA